IGNHHVTQVWQQAPPQNPASTPQYTPNPSVNTNTAPSHGSSMSQPLLTGDAQEHSLSATMLQQSTSVSAYPQTGLHGYPGGQSHAVDRLAESPLQEQLPSNSMAQVPSQTAWGPVSSPVNSVQPPIAPIPIQPAPSIPEPPAMTADVGGGTRGNHTAEGKPKKKTKWPCIKWLLPFMKRERRGIL
ncbi:hypothetical protein P691DRAFT_784303, partial [Macrolepiota fuliginosa MF-IS2]